MGSNNQPAVANSTLTVATPIVATPLPTATQPPPTNAVAVIPPVTGTSAPQDEYHLHIVKSGKDGLFLVNAGQIALPLARFQLGNPPNYVQGSQWEISALQPSECVLVLANGAKENKLKDIACEQVGSVPRTPKGKPFWESIFNVYLDEDFIGVCVQDFGECDILFPEPP